jgi:recombination protein RecT
VTAMPAQSISNAVATRDTSPSTMVQQYKGDFAAVLPSHIRPDTWVRLAVGALRRDPALANAAKSDPASLMASLLHAARLGLEPGTEEYYLTPRKERGQMKVLGIPGYQGLVSLMYRAGAVSSVIVECVYANDRFTYTPGRDDRPVHEIDWDLDDRGALRLVYAYAIMKDGATSKVVVLNKAAIAKIKASSQGADSAYSPWQKHEPAMWMKSAARQLAKWVPTSAEMVGVQAPVKVESQRPEPSPDLPPAPSGLDESEPHADPETGEVVEAELVDDADFVPEPPADWEPTR